MQIGETGRIFRIIFSRSEKVKCVAKNLRPCKLFFDEVEAAHRIIIRMRRNFFISVHLHVDRPRLTQQTKIVLSRCQKNFRWQKSPYFDFRFSSQKTVFLLSPFLSFLRQMHQNAVSKSYYGFVRGLSLGRLGIFLSFCNTVESTDRLRKCLINAQKSKSEILSHRIEKVFSQLKETFRYIRVWISLLGFLTVSKLQLYSKRWMRVCKKKVLQRGRRPETRK